MHCPISTSLPLCCPCYFNSINALNVHTACRGIDFRLEHDLDGIHHDIEKYLIEVVGQKSHFKAAGARWMAVIQRHNTST